MNLISFYSFQEEKYSINVNNEVDWTFSFNSIARINFKRVAWNVSYNISTHIFIKIVHASTVVLVFNMKQS